MQCDFARVALATFRYVWLESIRCHSEFQVLIFFRFHYSLRGTYMPRGVQCHLLTANCGKPCEQGLTATEFQNVTHSWWAGCVTGEDCPVLPYEPISALFAKWFKFSCEFPEPVPCENSLRLPIWFLSLVAQRWQLCIHLHMPYATNERFNLKTNAVHVIMALLPRWIRI